MPLPLLPKILTYTFATAHAATGLAALLGEVDLLQGVLLDTAKARACSCIAPEPRLLQSCIPQHEARPHR